MKENFTSYLITLIVLAAAIGAAWMITKIASPSTATTVGGSEASYAQLQQSILKP